MLGLNLFIFLEPCLKHAYLEQSCNRNGQRNLFDRNLVGIGIGNNIVRFQAHAQFVQVNPKLYKQLHGLVLSVPDHAQKQVMSGDFGVGETFGLLFGE